MKIQMIEPIGYCFGVKRAIEIAKNARKDYPHEKITILGMLAHNHHVMQELENDNIFCEPVINLNYEDALKRINEGIIIFTAHGHHPKLDEIALSKNLKIIDATCPFVTKTFQEILKAFDNQREIIYIGKRNHPESYAALAIAPGMAFYDINNHQLSKDIINDDPLVFNQTTLSYFELNNIHQEIKKKYKQATIHDEICSTSRLRQQGIDQIDKNTSLIYIIGDDLSNNTESLYRIAKEKYPHCAVYKISSCADITNAQIAHKEKVALLSGASTPYRIVQEIFDYLKNI